jgi:hypothetical protein
MRRVVLSPILDPTTGKTRMPIKVHADVRDLDQDEFGEIAFQSVTKA